MMIDDVLEVERSVGRAVGWREVEGGGRGKAYMCYEAACV